MDEVRSYVRLDLPFSQRQGRPLDCSTSSSNPILEGPWCRFRREARTRKRHRHRSQSDVLDPGRPIIEADISLPSLWGNRFDRGRLGQRNSTFRIVLEVGKRLSATRCSGNEEAPETGGLGASSVPYGGTMMGEGSPIIAA